MKAKKPSIKIVGITQKQDREEIETKIKSQNEDIFETSSNIEVTYIKEFKNKRDQINYTVYAEVDGNTYQRIIKAEKIYLGWDRCRVYDNVNILRCFNCNGFNHKAIHCKNEISCPKCAKSHDIKNCNEGYNACINCKSK